MKFEQLTTSKYTRPLGRYICKNIGTIHTDFNMGILGNGPVMKFY
jgi:hypothetical protein